MDKRGEQNSSNKRNSDPQNSEQDFFVQSPTISLPKGGGAISSIGEKFAANPVTGTGSLNIPITTSPGRGGFGPQLALSYDSGAGNGPFGFGWNLSLPNITRKTDKGLPQYFDAQQSDVFLLSAAEDLVPQFEQNGDDWLAVVSVRTVDDIIYTVKRYRPRIESLLLRIERWTREDNGDVHWRSWSADNVLTLYGKDENSRITDPQNPNHIFKWLISETRDDKGNAILYEYKPEDGTGVNWSQAHERNRGEADDPRRAVNRYLKRIRYANQETLLNANGRRPSFLTELQIHNTQWLFEVIFDYGEHNSVMPMPGDVGDWHFRDDPFSSYRAGFEVRTTRLCLRVLMFHHFEGEAEVGRDCLVRSTDFTYSHQQQPDNGHNPIYTFLERVTLSGYKRKQNRYLKREYPPLEFEYSQPVIQDNVEEVEAGTRDNLPIGVDGVDYQWTDLHAEGIPGILTEQGNTWFYKRNLSSNSGGTVKLGPLETVLTRPNMTLSSGARIMDLTGDGRPALVMLGGSAPGFYAHDGDESWQAFQPFKCQLNRSLNDPNLTFIDLDGDGRADLFISEDDAFLWHASLAEQGFGPAQRITQALDEENGPRLVFTDSSQSIYLADFSGDNLTDLVRIRNGQVCYWPNLGYGRFGPKVSMDGAPHFDNADQFEQGRIRLADIDGSGTTDIIYLHRDGVRLYFNQSGNSWSEPQTLSVFPRIDDLVNIVPTDLLGNGTVCLVWSSSLPGDAPRPMRYVNLMGGQKPHLLIKTKNNLGQQTTISYAPSTQFYLADKRAGKPWISKLPFPVHVVENVTVSDQWRKTTFCTSYSYHHGYFDGVEREFRGFGRVEQIDVENYDIFARDNQTSPYITDDLNLYQPPVKTVSWYHTGVFLDRKRVLSQFENEYFTPQGFREQPLPDLDLDNFNAEECREALRACKGMLLRQEIYELNIEALKADQHWPVKLFNTANYNCHIQRLQAKQQNRHAVFLVTQREAITYNYELDLLIDTTAADPRIGHSFNLKIDDYGNVLQSVTVVYPRINEYEDISLTPAQLSRITDVQKELHAVYRESHFTNDIFDGDNYRLPVFCETSTYDLTGISPAGAGDLDSANTQDSIFFTLEELQRFRLSEQYQITGEAVADLAYHRIANHITAQKRLVEHSKALYFDDNDASDATFLTAPLPFKEQGSLGLPYERYKLALTETLLNAVLFDKLTPEIQNALNDTSQSGYLNGSQLGPRFGDESTTGQYWISSGIAGFAENAANHFYLAQRFTDVFGQTTILSYDQRDLYVQTTTDPVGNTTSVEKFDYRVLAPLELKDINDNFSQIIFDVLGLPTATAMKGKGTQGDNLSGFTGQQLDPETDTRSKFFTEPRLTTETIAGYQLRQQTEARRLLGNATARHLYYFGETEEVQTDGSILIHWGQHPAAACGIVREKHLAQLQTDETSPLHIGFEYSDGGGNILVTKTQAEAEFDNGPVRWIANGKTILNNKGKPVKQYQPYFSTGENDEPEHRFKEPGEEGVTAILYYDAPGRLVRTEMPDGSFSRVTFSPWHVTRYDANDTAFNSEQSKQSDWYQRRTNPTHPQYTHYNSAEDQRCANMVAEHADTPATVLLDSLGREVISIALNRVKDSEGQLRDDKSLTFSKLDAEGKPLWIRDTRGNLVMQYITPLKPTRLADETDLGNPENMPVTSAPCYDISGNLLCQHSMDGGSRWMINDSTGQPFYAWDLNEQEDGEGELTAENRLYHTDYDPLRRPIEQQLRINDGLWQVIERLVYGETQANAVSNNLRGQVYQHYDQSGLITNDEFDFKGNLTAVTRQLTKAYSEPVSHWPENPPASYLDEPYRQTTAYDALNRMLHQENWHLENRTPAIYTPQYNKRGTLASETLTLRGLVTQAIVNITFDAKGQRTQIQYGNGTTTRYYYDPHTFRLMQLQTTRTGVGNVLPAAPSNLSDGNVIQNLYYTYDPVGNITEILDDAYEPVFFNNQQVEPRNRYHYDALYRLTEASGRENYQAQSAPNQIQAASSSVNFPLSDQALRNYHQRFDYDAVGNIEQMRHVAEQGSWTRHFAYAADSNRLLQTWIGSDQTSAITYSYDTHGSMLNLNRTPDEFRLRWNVDDMIHTANLGGGARAFYNYDSGKQRTCKRIERSGNIVEERLYLGGMERYRRWLGANVVEEIETYHLFDGSRRVLMVEDVLSTDSPNLDVGALYRYQYGNHVGSVGLELDDSGAIISYEEYHPYGTTAYRAVNSSLRTTAKRYHYTGMERDEESGLNYHEARYYVGWLGRWMSIDPEGLVDGLNIYAYVVGNPIKLLDTSGTQSSPNFIVEQKQEQIRNLREQYAQQYGSPPFIMSYKNPEDELRALSDAFGKAQQEKVDRNSAQEEQNPQLEMWQVAASDPIAAAFIVTGAMVSATMGKIFGFHQDPQMAARVGVVGSAIVSSVGGSGLTGATRGPNFEMRGSSRARKPLQLKSNVTPTTHRLPQARTSKFHKNNPGTVSGPGTQTKGEWIKQRRVGHVPKEVADYLRGRSYTTFDGLRAAIWRAIRTRPEFKHLRDRVIEIDPDFMSRKPSAAPRAPEDLHYGGHETFEIHHKKPVESGGGVYNVDNLLIADPRTHHMDFHGKRPSN